MFISICKLLLIVAVIAIILKIAVEEEYLGFDPDDHDDRVPDDHDNREAFNNEY